MPAEHRAGLELQALVSAAFAEDKSPGKAAASPLVGGYAIVKGESDGKPIPDDHIAGAIVKFTADEVIGTDKDKKHLYGAKYTLDTSVEPSKIIMKSTLPRRRTRSASSRRTAIRLC